ncbi:C2 calcium-dependent domain-containing protein 4C-like [Myripristis murdjan]|uniref:C2 domain-containing protein n=1 Tax=Myripristis murdjan TaxID=586833 RepID=A0A667XQR3_9TELE|nr:C2 calcium-dependent domain-containing protein 4C-like [Myripristis murdjan]
MWVLDQIRVSVDQNHFSFPADYSVRLANIMFGEKIAWDKKEKVLLCPNIITPSTIPEFCIPPKMQELRTPNWTRHLAATRAPSSVAGSSESKVSARETFSRHIIQVEDVDELLNDGGGFSDEESTNADPLSQAALSLPHLTKTQTCYGFCTLLESPHTRRKESLFHCEPGSCSLPLVPPRSRASSAAAATRPPHCASFSLNKLTSRLQSPRVTALHRQGTLDSDTTSSAESSPFNSPLLARPSPLKAQSHERLLSWAVRRAALSRNSSLSTDESSSTDSSPSAARRALDGQVEPPPATFSRAPPVVFPAEPPPCREKAARESLIPVGRQGALQLSAEYCPDNLRLRVRLISAEGLYPAAVEPRGINCSVSVCLLPGKLQKQRSSVIKRSRSPIFNEDFFFDGIDQQEVGSRSLRFKVVNKTSSMKRDYVLGDCEVLLLTVLAVGTRLSV